MGNAHKKQINTTLGELIAAVTDEVMPIAGSQANADALVSYIVNDLLIAKRVRLRKRAALRAVLGDLIKRLCIAF